MVRFMGRSLLLALVLSISAVSAQAQYGRYGGWGGWGGGVGTAQGSIARGAGVYAAGAGAYNEQTAVARSINANTAMQVNQYMYEVNKNNAKYYYTRSANKQKEASSTGEAIYKRLHDNPSGYDIHTGDALNVVLDELTNPDVYTQVVTGGDPAHRQRARQEHRVRVRRQHDRDQPGRLQRAGRSRLPVDDSGFRARSRGDQGAGRQGPEEIESKGQASAETLANCRVAIKALKAKVDSLLPQGAPNRLEADNYLKALYRPLQDARDTLGGSVPHGAEQGGFDDTGAPDRLHAHLQLAFRRGQDAGSGADLRSALPAARRGSRPGQGAQREPLYHLERPAGPEEGLRVFLRDAVRPETRRRASSPAPARPALMSGMRPSL